jgi:hypothetical protein
VEGRGGARAAMMGLRGADSGGVGEAVMVGGRECWGLGKDTMLRKGFAEFVKGGRRVQC